jgi:hypothetical protein
VLNGPALPHELGADRTLGRAFEAEPAASGCQRALARVAEWTPAAGI